MLQITLKGKTTKDIQTQYAAWIAAETGAEVTITTTSGFASRQEKVESEETELTLEGDVLPAARAYVKKHSKEKYHKILAKFDAKTTKDVNSSDYPSLMKLISNG